MGVRRGNVVKSIYAHTYCLSQAHITHMLCALTFQINTITLELFFVTLDSAAHWFGMHVFIKGLYFAQICLPNFNINFVHSVCFL